MTSYSHPVKSCAVATNPKPLDLDSLHPLRYNILVWRWKRPTQIGHIIVPEAYRGDGERQFWTPAERSDGSWIMGPDAKEFFEEINSGILVTPAGSGVPLGDGLFAVNARTVEAVIT